MKMNIKRRMSKMRRVLAGCLAVLLAASALCAVGCSSKKKAGSKGFVVSRTDADGFSYAFVDGGLKELGAVGQVIITPDRSHHIVLNEKEFIVYGKTLSSPNYVYGADSKGVWSVSGSISANGAFVTCEKPDGADAELYRVYFDDCKLIPMDGYATWKDYAIAENTLAIAYVNNEGGIFVWPEGGKCAVKIAAAASGVDAVNIVALSDKGNALIWCEDKDGIRTIRGWLGGEVAEICSYETADTNFSGDVYYTKDAKLAVVCDYDADATYICEAKKAAVKVKLDAEEVFTRNGEMGASSADDAAKGIYLLVEENNARSLYFVGVNGEREKVVGDIKRAAASNGQFFYIDAQNVLWCAAASDGKAFSGVQISERAVSLRVSENGKYVYYMSDYADSNGKLGRYDVNAKASTIVDENVYGSALFELSRDGKTAFYYKNVSGVNGVGNGRIGELFVSTVGKNAEKVASDVVVGTADSGYGTFFSDGRSAVDPKALSFLRYDEAVDGRIIASWMLYDGSGLKLLVDEIIYE